MSTLIRELPASVDSERSILGSILLDQSSELVIESAAAGLRPEDFHTESHRRIFRRMLQLSELGKPVDLVSVINAMTDPHESVNCGGAEYLSDLMSNAIQRSSVMHQVETLLDKSKRRQLYSACEKASAMVLDPSESTQECFSAISEDLLRIEGSTAKTTIQKLSDFSSDAYRNLIQLRDAKRDTLGMGTGVPLLDKLTTGVRRGELWIMGGRTGEGKSAFATQVARENARQGIPVGIFSPEMSKWQVLYRIWCHESGIAPFKLRDPRHLSPDEITLLSYKVSLTDEWPIHVDDTPNITVAQLAARARLMVKRFGCELLIVDYVQLISCAGRDEYQRVTAVSRALMAIKKELRVSILALSQLWRPKNSPNDRPTKYSFKESGSLENDADTVLAIYRPVDEDNQFMQGKEEINILKQREGKIGIVPVSFDEDALLFRAR